MNKNPMRGGAERGERAKDREASAGDLREYLRPLCRFARALTRSWPMLAQRLH
jgi:hypothetical protein